LGAFVWGFVATLFGVPDTLVFVGTILVAVGVGFQFFAKAPRTDMRPVIGDV
jgi:hypothetical protein